MKNKRYFIKDIYTNRYLLNQLVLRELTGKYKKSRLGMFWAIAEPIAFMIILYVVFGIGLRSGQNMKVPFVCYMSLGMAVINGFNSNVVSGTGAVNRHRYLLNKINVNLSLLPIAHVLAGFLDHLIFMLAVLLVLIFNNILPSLYWLQFIYYSFSLFSLVIWVVLITSSLGVIAPDIQSVMVILTRVLFYATPVFWDFNAISPKLQQILSFNPLVYIANGYRNTFYGNKFNLGTTQEIIYYWSIVMLMLCLGTFVFKKLKPHFADYM